MAEAVTSKDVDFLHGTGTEATAFADGTTHSALKNQADSAVRDSLDLMGRLAELVEAIDKLSGTYPVTCWPARRS